ncbi:MAG: flagellar motor switch protein FliM [Thermotogaceae bacterium]|jgi:flagellar motor switch protein FliM|nr:flagellar motor switch protein FliM [Thermotogaceae bacterium]MDN5337853.1 flagellar motor switch protein FliM [Thermotogaceae bacterium]
MSDILSQEEIDSLLSALTKGELTAEEIKESEEKKVKLYDFSKPSKFSKDQIRTFEMIHENFSRVLSTYLSGRTRSLVDVRVVSLDQITYNEFVRSIATPTFMVIFSAPELTGNAILEMNLEIIYGIIDKLLGGTGVLPSIPSRNLTEIEMSIMRREASTILSYLKEAWIDFLEFTPEIESIETNPQFVQIAPPSEMVLLITLSVTIGQIESFMNICWLSSTLEPFAQNFSTQMWFLKTSKGTNPQITKLLEENLKKANIDVSAVLGRSTLTLGELLNLEVGDVIVLNKRVGEEIDVLVQNVEKFRGIPGKRRNRVAVKITKVEEEIQEILQHMLQETLSLKSGGELNGTAGSE